MRLAGGFAVLVSALTLAAAIGGPAMAAPTSSGSVPIGGSKPQVQLFTDPSACRRELGGIDDARCAAPLAHGALLAIAVWTYPVDIFGQPRPAFWLDVRMNGSSSGRMSQAGDNRYYWVSAAGISLKASDCVTVDANLTPANTGTTTTWESALTCLGALGLAKPPVVAMARVAPGAEVMLNPQPIPPGRGGKAQDAYIIFVGGRYADAVVALTNAVRSDPDDAISLYNLGLAHLKRGQISLGKGEMSRAAALARAQGNTAAAARMDASLAK